MSNEISAAKTEKPSFKTSLSANVVLWARIEKYLREKTTPDTWLTASELGKFADIVEVCKTRDVRAEIAAVLNQFHKKGLASRPIRGSFYWKVSESENPPPDMSQQTVPQFLMKSNDAQTSMTHDQKNQPELLRKLVIEYLKKNSSEAKTYSPREIANSYEIVTAFNGRDMRDNINGILLDLLQHDIVKHPEHGKYHWNHSKHRPDQQELPSIEAAIETITQMVQKTKTVTIKDGSFSVEIVVSANASISVK